MALLSIAVTGILREIKLEWRKKAKETDPKKVELAIRAGMEGLKTLRMYVQAAEAMKHSPEVTINLTGGGMNPASRMSDAEKEEWLRGLHR